MIEHWWGSDLAFKIYMRKSTQKKVLTRAVPSLCIESGSEGDFPNPFWYKQEGVWLLMAFQKAFISPKFFKFDRNVAKLILCLPSACGRWLSSTSAPQGD